MGPGRTLALSATIHVGQYIEADLLGVVAGEECGARGPATGRVVELRVANALGGECVEVWRRDFAAVTTGVGEAHVVSDEDDEVGCPRGRRAIEGKRARECAKCG